MSNAQVTIGRTTALLGAAALVLATASVTYFALRAGTPGDLARTPKSQAAPAPGPASPDPAGAPLPVTTDDPMADVEVRLTPEVVARAGIQVNPVISETGATAVKIPAVIEPNAYQRVEVTPVVAGRVTRVHAELGDEVRRGATLATLYSPSLSDAQTKFLSARAEVEAAAQELRRTERLVQIGAASRQELERIRASHTSVATVLEGAAAQLRLLGMTTATIQSLKDPKDISATVSVPAPMNGTVITRLANMGLNVEPSMPLFTLVDLSKVWAVGDLYERDFARVQVGSQAMVTTTAYADRALQGQVTYIDPQLDSRSRTAKVRVEVANPRRELRLGMYAELQITTPGGASVVTVPRDAVQTIGSRQFVYLARPDQPGVFIEREVRIGNATPEGVEIASGVSTGDPIVTKGSFFVRAERERLGLRAAPGAQPPSGHQGMAMGSAPAEGARVTVTERGFEPARVTTSADRPVRVTFVRTTDNTCAKELLIPSLKVKRALPLNEPVVVELPGNRGEVSFTCGMDMLRGTVVIQ